MAQTLWLLGQDEVWLRPRASALPVAAAGGALVDLTRLGAARWVDDEAEAMVEPTTRDVGGDLPGRWAKMLRHAARDRCLPVIQAVGAVSPDIWAALGADLSSRGMALDVPRRVRRWLAPRRRPAPGAAGQIRTHLRAVITGDEPSTAFDHDVLAVAACAGVVEHVLSDTPFTDHSTVAQTAAFLQGNPLLPRLTPALSYLVSMGPVLGIGFPSGPGSGGAS